MEPKAHYLWIHQGEEKKKKGESTDSSPRSKEKGERSSGERVCPIGDRRQPLRGAKKKKTATL